MTASPLTTMLILAVAIAPRIFDPMGAVIRTTVGPG